MIKLKVVNAFFDRAAVIQAVTRAKKQNLAKAGAFVRQRAKTSIRKAKGVSKPGTPPHSHVGTLRRLIFFAWDFLSETVVVGPTAVSLIPTAPRSLEKGGMSIIKQRRRRRPKVRFVRARPYMAPALRAEASKFPGLWRNSIKP